MGNQTIWIRHRQRDLNNHIKFFKEHIIESVNKLCEEHCHETLLSLIAKRRGVESVTYNDVTDIAEVFDTYDKALIDAFRGKVSVTIKHPIDEVTDKLEKQFTLLKDAVDKSVFPSSSPTKDWVEKNKQELASRLTSVNTLNKAVIELQQILIHQMSLCSMLEQSLKKPGNSPTLTEHDSAPVDDNAPPAPVDDAPVSPQVTIDNLSVPEDHHPQSERMCIVLLLSNRL